MFFFQLLFLMRSLWYSYLSPLKVLWFSLYQYWVSLSCLGFVDFLFLNLHVLSNLEKCQRCFFSRVYFKFTCLLSISLFLGIPATYVLGHSLYIVFRSWTCCLLSFCTSLCHCLSFHSSLQCQIFSDILYFWKFHLICFCFPFMCSFESFNIIAICSQFLCSDFILLSLQFLLTAFSLDYGLCFPVC